MLLCRLYVRGMRGIWQPVLTFPPFLRARSTNVTVRIPLHWLQTRASKLQTILFLLYASHATGIWRVALTPSQMKKRSSRKKKNNQSNFLVYNFEIQLFSPSLLARLWKPLANTRFSFLPENQHGRRSVRVRWKGHHFLLFPYIFLWYSPRTLNLLCLEDHKITR